MRLCIRSSSSLHCIDRLIYVYDHVRCNFVFRRSTVAARVSMCSLCTFTDLCAVWTWRYTPCSSVWWWVETKLAHKYPAYHRVSACRWTVERQNLVLSMGPTGSSKITFTAYFGSYRSEETPSGQGTQILFLKFEKWETFFLNGRPTSSFCVPPWFLPYANYSFQRLKSRYIHNSNNTCALIFV
jgi:hypothetical protein